MCGFESRRSTWNFKKLGKHKNCHDQVFSIAVDGEQMCVRCMGSTCFRKTAAAGQWEDWGNTWATRTRTRPKILPLDGTAPQHYHPMAAHGVEVFSILYQPQLPPLHFLGWQHLRGLWPSGEFTTKLYTDVMKSNIGCAMSYEMLFSFRILLLQSVMAIFPFIWLLNF